MNSDWPDILAASALRGVIAVFRYVPLDAAGHMGDFGGRIACLLLPKKRQVAYWNMRLALGNQLSETERRKAVQAQFRHLGRNAAEVLSFEKLTAEEVKKAVHISAESWSCFEKVLATGRGIIFLTGHFGNWELMQIIAGMNGRPMHVLGRDLRHPRLNEILMKQRELHGAVAVSRGMGVRFLLKALKEGKSIGVLGDQSAGRDNGILLPFFGRVTTVPTGAFELARRTGAVVLPCFMARRAEGKHELFIEEPISCEGDNDVEVIRGASETYLKLLEKHISAFPDCWLWQNKRWKYSWTRKIVILSDKKPGHFKQSQAVAALLSKNNAYHGREGVTFETQTIEIEYRSEKRAKLLAALGWLLLPFIRGRLNWLKYFLTDATVQKLSEAQADFIVAAGSLTVPVQHLFAAETGAKKIVCMKPSFPYSLLNYDLAVIPAHDSGMMPARNFRTAISASGYGAGDFAAEAAQLSAEMGGQTPELAVFVGGPAHAFNWTVKDAEKLCGILEQVADKMGGYMLTTSRRTSTDVENYLKNNLSAHAGCRKLVIANEDARSFVVKGMLGLAERVVVTEDSVAMISEAVAAGKSVIVLRTASNCLPDKHRCFVDQLIERGWVTATGYGGLEKILSEETLSSAKDEVLREEQNLVEALGKLL